jgi:molybdopterin-containing oxidoreductase family iron-sulfur binding subunit
VQRIQTARQPAKDQGRPIADGEVKTACQQACPASAITFGNLRDPESEVSTKEKDDVRGYKALGFLNTRPGTTYLAKVRRGTVEG